MSRDLIDIHDPRIERDVGDPHGRTPHYVVDNEALREGKTLGVLYWPVSIQEGGGYEWAARAFHNPKDAIEFLDRKFPDTVTKG